MIQLPIPLTNTTTKEQCVTHSRRVIGTQMHHLKIVAFQVFGSITLEVG